MKKLLLIIVLCHNIVTAFSQMEINGQVITSDNRPVDAAYISAIDSSTLHVGNTLSDDKGQFSIKDLPVGRYTLNISGLGLEPLSIPIQRTQGKIDLGILTLASSAIEMEELVIEGKQIIQKPNSETYLPTQFQKRISHNGIELLNNLAIRGIYVNPIEMNIQKINGGAIQLRINNIRADVKNVMALRPDKILRVEYHDSPSGAYGGEGVEAVINYVTIHSESGGGLYADLSNAITTGLSNNAINTAFNTKSSEFSLNYFIGNRDYDQCRQDGNELFYYPNGTVYERDQQGINQPYSYTQHVISASYHLQSQNNYVFNILFKGEFLPHHSDNRAWNEYNNSNNNVLFTKNESSNIYNRPVLDIYYQKKINNTQEIIFDIVGTLWNEKNKSHFSQNENEKKVTDYQIFVKGKKRSAIFESIYSNQLSENSKLSAGVQHLQAYSNNIYSGNIDAKTDMNQANTYLFSEFSSKISNLNFSVGIGLNHSYFSEEREKYNYYNFRPSLSLKYIINDNNTITNRFRVLNQNPNLAQLSDIERFLDNIQVAKGNPDLKPYFYYINALTYIFNKKIIGFSTEFNYQYRKNPIMDNYYYDSDKLIRTSMNQKNWNQLKVESQISVGTLWNILRFSVGGGILSHHSNGLEYSNQLVSYYGFANIGAFYKNFSFSSSFKTKTKELFGETFFYYAPDISMQLQYIMKKQWLIGISAWNPFFSSLKNQFETKSKQTYQLKTINFGDNGNVFSLRLAYLFSFGRDYNTSNKKVNNSDAESGIMK
ncbi:MAG: TonB-dependent receptor family protein [Dysgonamonadaceae bacterium]|jgi:hypothetical protein|nr:TonB-dependent receptor family protein [Dysgonamonadaceae bacterium]